MIPVIKTLRQQTDLKNVMRQEEVRLTTCTLNKFDYIDHLIVILFLLVSGRRLESRVNASESEETN